MAFWARSFIFDGIPSEQFGLMLYNISGHEQEDGTLGAKVKIIEDRLESSSKPLHYGTTQNEPLEFKLIFGVEDAQYCLDRFDLQAVSKWLVGHQQYKWLSICQPDMENIQYRCIISQLSPITVGALHVAFEATITCDGPYAYHVPITENIECIGETEYLLRNPCNIRIKCLPKITISCPNKTDTVSIINLNCSAVPFTISGLSRYAPITIKIDAETGLIETDKDVPIYEMINFNFPSLLPGDNKIRVSGTSTVQFKFMPPINIGY